MKLKCPVSSSEDKTFHTSWSLYVVNGAKERAKNVIFEAMKKFRSWD